MTNLVHARRRLVSRHVTMAEAMKVIVERDDADVRALAGYYLIFITHLRQERLKSVYKPLHLSNYTHTLNSKIFNAIR